MLAELEVVQGFMARLGWVFGSITTLTVEWLKFRFIPGRRRAGNMVVAVIAGYHSLFTLALLATLTWQIPRITESWKYALPALLLCYGISLVPAVLGVGLILRDNAARIATIVLSIGHALLTMEYLHVTFYPGFPVLRIAVDVLMIALLTGRNVRSMFEQGPLL
jgi:hypothetical protein